MSAPKRGSKATDSANADDNESPGVLALIAAIQDGSLNGKTMEAAGRRACVEHLAAEGYSVVETAGVLRVSERTVARDRAAIAEANALRHDPHLAGRIAGRLLREAEACVSRIRRATRAADTPASAKVQGEQACWQIVGDLSARLQSLGYLPTAAQQVQAQVAHHAVVELPSAAAMEAELQRLAAMGEELLSGRPDLTEHVERVRQDIQKLRLSDQVGLVRQSLTQEIPHEPR